jgi:hypothetical protein
MSLTKFIKIFQELVDEFQNKLSFYSGNMYTKDNRILQESDSTFKGDIKNKYPNRIITYFNQFYKEQIEGL